MRDSIDEVFQRDKRFCTRNNTRMRRLMNYALRDSNW